MFRKGPTTTWPTFLWAFTAWKHLKLTYQDLCAPTSFSSLSWCPLGNHVFEQMLTQSLTKMRKKTETTKILLCCPTEIEWILNAFKINMVLWDSTNFFFISVNHHFFSLNIWCTQQSAFLISSSAFSVAFVTPTCYSYTRWRTSPCSEWMGSLSLTGIERVIQI